MDALEKINVNFQNSDYKQTLKEIDNYFELKEMGIYDALLDIYIISQIRLGLFDEALKNIKLLKKYFPSYYMNLPFELASRYALCFQKEELQKLLDNNIFTNEEYFKIAFNCSRNGNVEVAKKLYEKIISTESKNSIIRAKSLKILEKIKLYEEYHETAFLKQSYAYFKYCGNKLEPGHVIFTHKFREEFKENRVNSDSKVANRPYMVWKIEDDIIYAFPITTQLNKNRYTFFTQDYAFQHPDRCLKDRLVVIKECDISNIEEKINEKDFEKAISYMYRSVCSSRKGIYQDDIAYFIHEVGKEKVANIGDVIVIHDHKRKYNTFQFVFDIDNERDKYKTVEIDYSFNIKEELVYSYIDVTEPVLNTFVLADDSIRENLLSYVNSNYTENNSMVGLVFYYDNMQLEILEENVDCYICLNITNGINFDDDKIFFVNKNISLLKVAKVSEEELNEHQKLFEEYKNNNLEEFEIKKEELKRVRKKKSVQ